MYNFPTKKKHKQFPQTFMIFATILEFLHMKGRGSTLRRGYLKHMILPYSPIKHYFEVCQDVLEHLCLFVCMSVCPPACPPVCAKKI